MTDGHSCCCTPCSCTPVRTGAALQGALPSSVHPLSAAPLPQSIPFPRHSVPETSLSWSSIPGAPRPQCTLPWCTPFLERTPSAPAGAGGGGTFVPLRLQVQGDVPPWDMSAGVNWVGASIPTRGEQAGGAESGVTTWYWCHQCHCMASVVAGVTITAWPPGCGNSVRVTAHFPGVSHSVTMAAQPHSCHTELLCSPAVLHSSTVAPWSVTWCHCHRAVHRVSLSLWGRRVPRSVTAAPVDCHTESSSVPGAGAVTQCYVTA